MHKLKKTKQKVDSKANETNCSDEYTDVKIINSKKEL